jgi:alpha-D-xyloside xylohydrolase
MGPYLQYATEKVADPVEIRVYSGANADFVLYEDENDTYNYESGKNATIAMNWNETEKVFTIGERKGEFPGMPGKRTFNIVWVNTKNGTGIEPSKQSKMIQYTGETISIKK